MSLLLRCVKQLQVKQIGASEFDGRPAGVLPQQLLDPEPRPVELLMTGFGGGFHFHLWAPSFYCEVYFCLVIDWILLYRHISGLSAKQFIKPKTNVN